MNVAILHGPLEPLTVGRPHRLYQMTSQQGNNHFLCGPGPQGPYFLLPWIHPPTRAPPGIELWSFRLCAPPVCRVLMEFRPSPFFFLFSPCSYFHFSTFCPAAFGCVWAELFPYSPHLRPLSTSKNSSLPSVASLSPSSPLHAVYLPSSVVQVGQIVVLILKSVF